MAKKNGRKKRKAHFQMSEEMTAILDVIEPQMREDIRPSTLGGVTDSHVCRMAFLEGLRSLKARYENEDR